MTKYDLMQIKTQAKIASKVYSKQEIRLFERLTRLAFFTTGIVIATSHNSLISFILWSTPYLLSALKEISLETNYRLSLENYLIKNTEEYKRLNELYREYVKYQAKLIKEISGPDILEMALCYTLLTQSGFFSINNVFNVTDVDDIFPIKDIYGAQIVTGSAVCRHLTANLYDIFQELGILSNIMSCKIEYLPENKKARKKPSILFRGRASHSVLALATENGKIIYDPINIDVYSFQTLSPSISYSNASLSTPITRLLLYPTQSIMPGNCNNEKIQGELLELSSIPNRTVSIEEYKDKITKLQLKFIINLPLILSFDTQTKEIKEAIAAIYSEINKKKNNDDSPSNEALVLKP